MPLVSLSMRASAYAEETPDVAIVLVTITHPSLAAPVYLSSDPTQRLSVDPLAYGTISNGVTYQFVLMSAIVPGDGNDTSSKAQLELENVESDMVKVMRSFTDYATVDFKLVMASNPDFVERHFPDRRIAKATATAEKVTLDIIRWPIEMESIMESWPSGRQTRSRFPGLWH